VERAKYSRRRRRGRGSYPAQLRCLAGGGNTEASGELRELFGWWTAILLIFPLFLLFFLLCLCYFLFLFWTVFSPLMVVLLLSTVTQDGSCGGDEEGRRWCPCLFLAVAYVFFLFLLFFLLSVSATFYFCSEQFSPLWWWCYCCRRWLKAILLVRLFSLHIITCKFFLVQIAINFWSFPVCFFFCKALTHVKSSIAVYRVKSITAMYFVTM
jgi:hypothetical protein